MSLTSFLDRSEVVDKVKAVRPKLSRKIDSPLKIEPRTNHYMLVGTAFDYLLRFELQRHAPHAVSERWVAEYAPGIILRGPLPEIWMVSEEISERARQIVEEAKEAVSTYVKSAIPNSAKQAELAGHAIRLAKLDPVFRVHQLDASFEEADSEDVQDLLNMLAIVPFESLLHKESLLLNPSFKESSHLVGGADTDLIAGDLLVDFKTTKKSEIQAKFLDQLFGYLLLALKQRHIDQKFPAINRLGLYYCRHGYLWVIDATIWTEHLQFSEVEDWFFKHAIEVFGSH